MIMGIFGYASEKFFGIIESLFRLIFDAILYPFKDLKDLEELVYGKGSEELVYHTFTANEITKAISPGVATMQYIVMFFLILGIISAGMKISASEMNPAIRTSFIEYIRDWIFVALILGNIGFVYEVFFMINEFFVKTFSSALDGNLKGHITPKLTGDNFFGWMFVMIMVIGITLWANFYYLMRKLTLMIFMIIGPIFISLWMFPSTKRVTLGWAREMFGTVMVQSVHAVTFWIVGTIASGLTEVGENTGAIEAHLTGSDVGIIELTLLYLITIPLGEAIRNLLTLGGDMTGHLTRFSAMAGLSGLAGVYGSVKGALNGKSVVSALRDGYDSVRNRRNGEENITTPGANAGVTIGTDTKAASMLKAGQIVSKGGKMALGSVGAIAGSVMGPKGALIGSTIGASIGSVGGGLAGRLGYAGALKVKEGFAAIKNGTKEAKNNIKNAAEMEKMAQKIGDLRTDAWAAQNEQAFKENMLQNNPLLTPEQQENMWQQKVLQQRKAFRKQALNDLKAGKYTDARQARASELAEATARSMTNEWAARNKDAFLNEMRDNGMNEEEATAAWGREVKGQYKNFLRQSKGVAKQLTAGKPFDSYIDRNSFAERLAQHQLNSLREGFRKDYFAQNPNASEDDFNNAWQQEQAKHYPTLLHKAKNAVSSVPTISSVNGLGANSARGSDLAQQVAKDMTKNWAAINKQNFVSSLEGQQLSEVEIEQKWNEQIQGKYKEYLKNANLIASNMANGNSLGTHLDKTEFAKQFAQQQLGQMKEQYVQQQMSEGVSREQAESMFDNSNAGKLLEKQVLSSVSSIPSLAASKGFETREGIAHQVATQLTNAWATPKQKEAFIDQFNQQYGGQAPKSLIENAWNEKVSTVYNGHLQDAQNRINEESLKGFVLPSLGGVIKGVGSGFYQGSGLKNKVENITEFIGDMKGTQFVKGTMQSLSEGSSIRESIAFGKEVAETFIPDNATQKQFNFTRGIAYATGILGGINGYQSGATMASKYNPYNQAVEQTTMEVSDIARYVKKEQVEGPDGKMVTRIADGAIQLVVERDRSYVQVQGNDNRMIRVGGFGAGDSSLSEGEVLFQEYTIQDNALIPRNIKGSISSVFKRDTAGFKVMVDKALNINANELLANRRQIFNQEMEPIHHAYNQSVTNGTFSFDDFKTHSCDQVATVVIEKDRSYLAMNGHDNRTYRISEFGPGNPKLQQGQVVYKEYVLENGRFSPSSADAYELNPQGERVIHIQPDDFSSKINPNTMLYKKPNPRLEKRILNEHSRFKQGVV